MLVQAAHSSSSRSTLRLLSSDHRIRLEPFKMRLLTGSFLALIAVAMAQPTKENKEQALRAVSDSASLFSSDFTKKVAEDNPGNLITSPLSASLVLSMASYGSGGETQKQFQNVLHLPTPEQKAQIGFQALIDGLNNVEGVDLSVANKIFVNKDFPIKPNYSALTSQYFRSTSESVNFNAPTQAAEVINNWVKQETHNRIDGIVDADSLDPSTALVLTNAVYFKGLWKYSFNSTDTMDRPFYINGETPKNVPTMYRKINTRYGESTELGAKILELPYKGEKMSMVIILPNDINGLAEVERKLQNVNLGKLMDENAYSREVHVYLPKFKIESTLDLMNTLQKMGMTDMFTRAANFSGISDAPLYVSKVMQKAFIEVNEEGSEASAVTAIEFVFFTSLVEPPKPPQMRVDRPFHYFIRDTTSQVVLFEGNVYLPTIE